MASHLVSTVSSSFSSYFNASRFARPTFLERNRIASTVHSTTKFVPTFSPLLTFTHEIPKLQIGACRHGDRCSRKHIKPPFSQTILLPNVYHNPAHDPVCKLTEKELQEGFDAVYEDLYCELSKFGHLLELHVSLLFVIPSAFAV